MMRFLRYAVDHERKIRVVFLLDGKPMQKTVTVLSYDEDMAVLSFSAKKPPLVLPIRDLLGCDYARGDHGED